MFIDSARTERMLKFLEREYVRYRRSPGAAPLPGELDLSFGYSVEISAPASPLTEQMEADFAEFMQTCMNVHPSASAAVISFKLSGISSKPLDESFRLEVTSSGVNITAPHERGLLQASQYMKRAMAKRGGPYLPTGVEEKEPAFIPRIGQTVFCLASGSIDNPIMLTDKYMALMSLFGVNGIHIYLTLSEYAESSVLPELNHPERMVNLARLNSLCERAGRYGIDIYATVITGTVECDSAVFEKHPRAKGALLNYPNTDTKHCLCSSSPEVLSCYRESFEDLFRKAPLLGGVALLVGGEGFIHCFTRPVARRSGETSCPHCNGSDPSENVAHMVNTIAEGVHRAKPHALVMAWPYSAFTWSGEEDFSQTRLLSLLSRDVEVISNFEVPFFFELGGAKASLIDYNIVNLGPSEVFKEQSNVLKGQGKRHYAKLESSTEPGWFFLPYLPVPYRWVERVRRMKEWDVPGYISHWRFYGFTGSISEEIFCEMNWNRHDDADKMLMEIARRDFGRVSEKILEGWKILSDTWEKIPASHMIYGEREFYMKGPAYLGPAHPLIFDVQKRYNLGSKFFTLRGDAGEFLKADELEEAQRSAPPRYSSDLLFTYPYGPAAVEEGLRSASENWDAGVSLIREALGDDPNERGRMELNICRIIGAHLHTLLNVTRFYRTRDALFTSTGTLESFRDGIERLSGIIDDETANAEGVLDILDSDDRIGYGYCYGQVYDAEMVREKLEQCRYVRGVELPDFRFGVTFHVYSKYRMD